MSRLASLKAWQLSAAFVEYHAALARRSKSGVERNKKYADGEFAAFAKALDLSSPERFRAATLMSVAFDLAIAGNDAWHTTAELAVPVDATARIVVEPPYPNGRARNTHPGEWVLHEFVALLNLPEAERRRIVNLLAYALATNEEEVQVDRPRPR